MNKVIFYVATSLDGYLADEQGGVDWLTPFQDTTYDYGYAAFYEKIGIILTGSKTYEQAKNFPGGWAFPHALTYVFSARPVETDGRTDIIWWEKGPGELLDILETTKDIWLLGGASLAASFFDQNLVDEVVLSIMPVMLGRGEPLFQSFNSPLLWQLKHSETYPNGVVQLVYGRKA